MTTRQFGQLHLDPARNPAVLDTATWDTAAAGEAIRAVPDAAWAAARQAWRAGTALPPVRGLDLHPGSHVGAGDTDWCLATLADGQQVLLAAGRPPADPAAEPPLVRRKVAGVGTLAAWATTADTVAEFARTYAPAKAPRALGPVARLGIGVRLSAAAWPGIWPAMIRGGFMANAIQNSVRELNLLADLQAGRPPRTNFMFGFGHLDEGHTGSTFEGLWLYGVLDALKHDATPGYGADADHIMVKRTPDGLDRARQVIAAARHYTFLTIDVSDLLEYQALADPAPAVAQDWLDRWLPGAAERRQLLACHADTADGLPALPEPLVGCLVGKHWRALQALGDLAGTITAERGGQPFDLELSIDEVPPGVRTWDVVTTDAEVVFLLREIRRRGLPVTHIAPNLGVEKGGDYRCPDGLPGLEQRTRTLTDRLAAAGLMLDCHSGDDLSRATRRVIGRATAGRGHFKISPSLQILFAETLHELYPDEFRFWWDDAVAYARREADKGSAFAGRCLQELAAAAAPAPHPHHAVFHHFCFATLGRRDETGAFRFRDRFYSLPAPFYAAYRERLTERLLEVADDVLHGG